MSKLTNRWIVAGALALTVGFADRFVPAQVRSGVVYVKTATAEIREGPRLSSATVATVERGAALTVVEGGRIRLKVRTTAGAEGYIARTKVQEEAPDSEEGGLGRFIVEDRGPEEMRSAVSGRGLMDAAEKMAEDDPSITDEVLQSVIDMEDLAEAITEAEVDRFVREGGQ